MVCSWSKVMDVPLGYGTAGICKEEMNGKTRHLRWKPLAGLLDLDWELDQKSGPIWGHRWWMGWEVYRI